ncbi:MAG: hypothetical protein ACL93V_03550 [Candidatus Electrothrix sp. YB6]
MEAIRKIQTVKNGRVHLHLPKQFWGKQVEIIVLSTAHQKKSTAPEEGSLRGCLRRYADSSLIAREHEAWQDAVKEKHGPC